MPGVAERVRRPFKQLPPPFISSSLSHTGGPSNQAAIAHKGERMWKVLIPKRLQNLKTAAARLHYTSSKRTSSKRNLT